MSIKSYESSSGTNSREAINFEVPFPEGHQEIYEFKIHKPETGGRRAVIMVPGANHHTHGEADKILETMEKNEKSCIMANLVSMSYSSSEFDLEDSVFQIRSCIEKLKEEGGVDEVVITGHSFGGVVVRKLVQSMESEPIEGISVKGLLLISALLDNSNVNDLMGVKFEKFQQMREEKPRLFNRTLGLLKSLRERLRDDEYDMDIDLFSNLLSSIDVPDTSAFPESCSIYCIRMPNDRLINNQTIENELLEIAGKNNNRILFSDFGGEEISSHMSGHKINFDNFEQIIQDRYIPFFNTVFDKDNYLKDVESRDARVIESALAAIEQDGSVERDVLMKLLEKSGYTQREDINELVLGNNSWVDGTMETSKLASLLKEVSTSDRQKGIDSMVRLDFE